MAGSETLTSGEYIKHHLTNLTFGQFPDGHWGIANSAEQAKEGETLATVPRTLDVAL